MLVHTDRNAQLVAEVTCGDANRRVHVEVADADEELPHRWWPGESASSGRGLLMEMLADAWGVDPRGEGKSIWFELYESAAPESGPDPDPDSPA